MQRSSCIQVNLFTDDIVSDLEASEPTKRDFQRTFQGFRNIFLPHKNVLTRP
jgi:hypothetical protein